FDQSFGGETPQKWLAQTSVNFDISVLELIWTISRGHQIVLQPSDPTKLLGPEQLQEQQPLDFSIMFFGADKSKEHKYDLLLDTVKFADENGLTAIWTPERHFGEFGGAFPSPAVMSSALAALTKRIQVRSGSVVLPLHDPVRVAEEWSIIDNLSNGRIGLSIASGWHPNDFVFYDADYQNRHQIMRDKIVELKQLWKGVPLIRKNGVGQDFEIKIRPTPLQKELPIWVTAAGNPKTFEYAGEIGANILTHMLGQSLEQLAENIQTYHAALEANGFKKEDTIVTLMLHTYIEADEEAAHRNSERAFKEYLESSIKLIEPMAKAEGLDIHTQREEIIEIAYHRFSRENTLIGSPESCQYTLQKVLSVGVNEIACLVDFGVEHEKVLAGLEKIAATQQLFRTYRELYNRLEVDRQENVLDLIRKHELSHVQMTPSQSKMVWNMVQIHDGMLLDSIRHWFIGGEAVPQELIHQLRNITQARFYNMYGPTETTIWS
ncbi:MAG: LLM class flavin-dependent oxidoreductase, partial [Phaeodactylibacter sp.]|nr:LLM class flavin-dependent oxidoreductase [Phaeodactylibacter sp.]